MSMGIALTFSNARAVLEAVLGIKTPFVRTPKYKIEETGDTTWVKKSYVRGRLSLPWLELLFALYFVFNDLARGGQRDLRHPAVPDDLPVWLHVRGSDVDRSGPNKP